MLQYRTIEPGTLDLLRRLMTIPELRDFYLVGGTALSLYYGHRLSIDIDLFSTTDFKTDTILAVLENGFPDLTYSNPNNTVGIFGFIGDIKVDLVRHHYYPLIDPPYIENNIRLASTRDIMAMKVAAILKRAVKKDFWDIAELLKHYTVNDLIGCYTEKYPSHQLLISIPQVLTYFAEAEESDDPVSLNGQTWEEVQKMIQQKVNEYLR